MPNVKITDEIHERLRVRAHRTGRSMSSVANALLADALHDSDEDAQDESAIALDLISAVARKQGAEAGMQALLRYAGAGLRPERSSR